MSETLLFDTDPLTGSIQLFHWDEEHERFWIEDRQDVTALIAHNKAVQNDDNFRPTPKSELRRVASIPLNILQGLRRTWRERGLSWEERQAAMKRWLNDPDNRFFRTDTSHI